MTDTRRTALITGSGRNIGRTMALEYGAKPLDLNITTAFCEFLAGFSYDDLPTKAVHEAKRGVLDWIGCAIAGSRHPTISKTLAVLSAVGGKPQATVFGRNLKLGLLEAPIMNGQMGHILDYDDTHMDGVILHTSSPVLAALFALAEHRHLDGRTLIAAYAAGFEAGVRTGKASPDHHDGGWHLTGTLGTIAAGVAAGRAIGLDGTALTYAIGTAATQCGGMQQNRGTMCKSFHAGRAASNGVMAALLAEQGFDSSPEIIEGKRGFCRIYSATSKPEAVLDQLGSRWEIMGNGYKPYACGIVQHPLIDAMIDLGDKTNLGVGEIERIDVCVHPGVVTITGVHEPESGLKSKFSLTHSASVAFLDHAAGIAQYSDQRAMDSDIAAMRGKIVVETDDNFRRDEARAIVVTKSGETHEVHIEHANGTIDNPMSDAALEEKFRQNAEPVIGVDQAEKIIQLVWQLDELPTVDGITHACAKAVD
jgi:2-methylcitrate dehydratase PrpD